VSNVKLLTSNEAKIIVLLIVRTANGYVKQSSTAKDWTNINPVSKVEHVDLPLVVTLHERQTVNQNTTAVMSNCKILKNIKPNNTPQAIA
jgi:hypothetical protein